MFTSVSVTVSVGCVYCTVRRGLSLLHRMTPHRPRSIGQRRLASPRHIAPSWPPERMTEPGPKSPPETILQQRLGTSQNLHPVNPVDGVRLMLEEKSESASAVFLPLATRCSLGVIKFESSLMGKFFWLWIIIPEATVFVAPDQPHSQHHSTAHQLSA